MDHVYIHVAADIAAIRPITGPLNISVVYTKNMKSVLIKMGDWLLNWLIAFLIILLPVTYYFQFIITQPDQVKTIVRNTGIYDKLVGAIVDQTVSEIKKNQPTDLPLQDPRITAIFKNSISPESSGKYVEVLIDGVYRWLNSPNDRLEGIIDYSDSKIKIVDQLVIYAQERTAGLPPCSLAQMRSVGNDYNILNTPCLPQGTNVENLTNQLREQLNRSDTPLSKDRINLADTGIGQALTKAQTYKTYFKMAQKVFWINLIIFILLLSGFLYRHRNRKLRAIYSASLKNAIALVVLATVTLLLYSKNPSNSLLGQNQFGKDIILPLGYGFVSKLAYIQYAFATILGLAGLTSWVILKKSKKPVSSPK